MAPVLVLVAAALAEDPAALVYDYRGPTGEGSRTAAEIVDLVRAAPREAHLVRGPGAPDWRPWNEVPELALVWIRRVPGAAPTPAPAEPVPEDPPPLGAGETPPRNAPPPDVGHAVPVAPPPRPAVRVGGDVRLDLLAADLEALDDPTAAASLGFVVSRARPVFDVALGGWFSGRLAVEARQDPSALVVTATDVVGFGGGWTLEGREVWLAAAYGGDFRQTVRVGLQAPAFGVRETYEERYPFAGEARADYARQLGLIPEEDLGLGWRGALRERLVFDLQVLNGTGGASLDTNVGKDLVSRAALDVGPVTASASGLYGARGLDSAGHQAQGALAVDVHGPNQRVLLEGLLGTTTEDGLDTLYSGYAVSGAWDVPVTSAALRHVSVVARASFFDPVAGLEAPDAEWRYGAGGWLAWNVLPGHTVRTGATWHAHVPQDADLPIEHELVAEAAWRF